MGRDGARSINLATAADDAEHAAARFAVAAVRMKPLRVAARAPSDVFDIIVRDAEGA